MDSLLLIHFGMCLLMTGVIWLVQVVHYPSFAFVSVPQFFSFSRFHQSKITMIVLPLMTIELVTAVFLLMYVQTPLVMINLSLLLLIWISTFFLSMSIHRDLNHTKSDYLIKKLIVTNWPRTIIWSLRSGIIYYVLVSSSGVIYEV